MGPSLLSKSLQAVGVSAFASTAVFFVWTKHCRFSTPGEFNPSTDPALFQSTWLKKFNPRGNEATYDECVRRIPLFKIRPEYLEDARRGGSGLVEAFSQGVWGGFGYTIQRLYLSRKYRNDTTTAHQLWDKSALLSSTYEPGTQITDHFVVLSKTPTSILIRCGDSPLSNPDGPRQSDGLFEMVAKADFDKGFAEFRMKSVFYVGDEGDGDGKDTADMLEKAVMGEVVPKEKGEVWENKGPMQGSMLYAHKLYTKLWMESAMSRIRQ